ncbi:MAG: hypothetical protein OXH85_04085 [Truepera sp.]|nr:hypothetical protein [Truepera sp.]
MQTILRTQTFRAESTDLEQRFPEATVHRPLQTAPRLASPLKTEHGRIDARRWRLLAAERRRGHTRRSPQLGINLLTLFNTTAVLPHLPNLASGFILRRPSRTGPEWWRMSVYGAAKGAVASYLRSDRAKVEVQGAGVSILWGP